MRVSSVLYESIEHRADRAQAVTPSAKLYLYYVRLSPGLFPSFVSLI